MTPATMAAASTAAAPRGPLREFWGYFSANRGAVAGLVFVIAVLLMAAFANVLAPYPPDLTNSAVFLKPPAWQAGGSWAYPLGTDAIGRDILSRLIHGARLSLTIGIAVVALAIVVGIALGLIAGFLRGVVEIAIMRLMDIILTLPSLLLAIVIVADPRPGPDERDAGGGGGGAAALRAHHARRGDHRDVEGLRHGGARERRDAAAADVQRGAAELRRAADRAGVARASPPPSSTRRRWASSAWARSRRRPSGARCSPTRASSCCARGGS